MGRPPQRILCLWFPDWALQRRIVVQPELEQCVLLLIESRKQGEFVRYGNRLAKRRGVRREMPVSEGRTFVQGRDRLVIEEVQPLQDRKALVEIALRCERFSFRIGVEESDFPESILMDVSGIAHFFSGEQGLVDELDRAISEKHYEGRIAISSTIGSAWAAAQFLTDANRPVVVPGGETQVLNSLPIAALRLNEPTQRKLHRLGIQTIEQVLTLDRISLAQRLGREILLQLDQFTGRIPEAITPCHPLPHYRVEKSFEDGISCLDAMEPLLSSLLRKLLSLLTAKPLGIRLLECQFHLEDRTSQTLNLRLCQATRDQHHIGELLRIHQEKIRLHSPIVGVCLEAREVVPLEVSQEEMFEGTTRDHSRQLSRLLNRFSSRLGEHSVVFPRLLSDPIPERAVELSSVTGPSLLFSMPFAQRFHGLDRPTGLFVKPRPIEVIASILDGPPVVLFWQGKRFDVAECSEPERIETGWWQEEYVCRDYYRVETTSGAWLWIFRRLQDNGWFWHGEWF